MIGITGATGALSYLVLTHLAKREEPIRLLARNVGKASSSYRLLNPIHHFDARYCDYADYSACLEALRGVDTLLFVSGTESQHRLDQHKSLVDAAVKAGVRTIIYTSFRGAAPDAIFHHARDHYHTEEYIKSTSLPYIFLRNAFYQDILPSFAVDGVIRGPGGQGIFSPVARNDVAQVIGRLLQETEEHVGKTYNLTGPEELTLDQVARRIGAVYMEETTEEAVASRQGAEEWLVDAWISTYTAIKDGEEAGLSGDVELITGSGPMRLIGYNKGEMAGNPCP